MMSIDKKQIIKNTSFVFGAQFITLLIGIARSLILPAFLTINSYGYWQIYLFYTTYVGLFCLGFNDGIYLKYGEYNYAQLPFDKLRNSIRIFVCMLALFTCISTCLVLLFVNSTDFRFAYIFAAFSILIMGINAVFIFILQITNQLKKYSFFSILDKVLVLLTIGCLFILDNNNYKFIIIADFIAKIIVTIGMLYVCKELCFGPRISFSQAYKEFKDNINVGIKLMFAGIMSMLLVGAGKLVVQFWGNIEEYAIYSFGISITGLVLTGITAFSLVLYPVLKRLPYQNYQSYFQKINLITQLFGYCILLFFFPAYWFIETYYSKYGDVLIYLNILFAIVYLQSKISILNNTFYKVLREEKALFMANLTCVLVFIGLALLSFSFYNKIWVIALCTFLAMLFRCYSSEIFLKKKLLFHTDHKYFFEIGYLIFFLVVTSFFNLFLGCFIFCLICILSVFYNKSRIGDIFQTFRFQYR